MIVFRSILFSGLLLLSIFITPLITGPLALWYALRWYAPELIVLGLAIDVYFGSISNLPYYTLAGFIIVIAAELAKNLFLFR